MAFKIEGNKNNKGLPRLILLIVGVAVFVFATYYLFFTVPPQIEVLVPPELMTISQISAVNIDPSAVINSEAYQSLKKHVDPPQFGIFGREKPFSRF